MRRLSLALVALVGIGRSSGFAQQNWSTLESSYSSMTYHLVHPLHEIEASSSDVKYRIVVDVKGRVVKSVTGDVDVTTFNSGNSNRDSHAMEVIDAIDFPDSHFESTSVVQQGDSLMVSGKLTFHGVTRDIFIPATAAWSQGKLSVAGAYGVSLTDFKIERPALLMVPVQDNLSFNFTAAFGF